MPFTATNNRARESVQESETAAPHPEEMKAVFDLTIGNTVSVKASVRTTPAGLLATAILAALPERYRRILELRFLESCSIKEAAQAMGVSISNAKVLQHRALRMAAKAGLEVEQ